MPRSGENSSRFGLSSNSAPNLKCSASVSSPDPPDILLHGRCDRWQRTLHGRPRLNCVCACARVCTWLLTEDDLFFKNVCVPIFLLKKKEVRPVRGFLSAVGVWASRHTASDRGDGRRRATSSDSNRDTGPPLRAATQRRQRLSAGLMSNEIET